MRWEKPQIEQLVEDVWDYAFTESERIISDKTPYFIGNLIVYNRSQENGDYIYETIDGQQRLTTVNDSNVCFISGVCSTKTK